jgi:hypothetical protein
MDSIERRWLFIIASLSIFFMSFKLLSWLAGFDAFDFFAFSDIFDFADAETLKAGFLAALLAVFTVAEIEILGAAFLATTLLSTLGAAFAATALLAAFGAIIRADFTFDFVFAVICVFIFMDRLSVNEYYMIIFYIT